MPWFRIDFDKDQFVKQIPSKVSYLCFQLMKTCADTGEMVILSRMAPGDNVYESYFFSPKASELLSTVIQQFNGKPCEQPIASSTFDLTRMVAFVAGDHPFFMKYYGKQASEA